MLDFRANRAYNIPRIMTVRRIIAVLVLVLGVFLGYAVVRSEGDTPSGFLARRPFHLGLDLSGGSHLIYTADISAVSPSEIDDSMDALRDVIERRINLFGVAEPTVQVQTATLGGETQHRLSIELPGVTDISEAIAMIGQTPYLEFRTQTGTTEADISFVPTALTGKYLQRALLQFAPNTAEPIVVLQFNAEGSALFEEITRENVGKVVAIYLDGQPISAPVVREAISGGEAVISGGFTPDEAKLLVGRLNSGALPVPITLASTQTIGATLGGSAVTAGVQAALIGFIIVALFLIVWYRLPGLIAVLALALYVVMTLVLYKLIPVTLTAAGIAGFIISIGMAVDANILIFERTREERRAAKQTHDAFVAGFARAWTSIRDANNASIIVAIILFWFGTSLIKGFALTLGLGVFVSLLSAITITRLFLLALPTLEGTRIGAFLYGSGFTK